MTLALKYRRPLWSFGEMWRLVLATLGLSKVLGVQFYIGRVSSLVSLHYTTPRSIAHRTRACRFGPELGSKSRRTMRSALTAVASSKPSSDDLKTVPKDNTFNPVGFLREVIAAPVPSTYGNRFDTIGKKTGGIWRSRVMGFPPSTVRHIIA